MNRDPEALAASLRGLDARVLEARDLTEALHDVTLACVDLFAVTGGGVMLADEQNFNRYVTASDDVGQALEVAELDTGQGPCTEAFIDNTTVASPDLRTEPRWSALALRLRDLPIRAVLGVPIRLGAVPVGTLDVYVDRPREWEQSIRADLSRYGEVISATLATALAAHQAEELAGQLQYALDFRIVIERGVGFLMARDEVDAVTAFNRLRSSARSNRMKVGEVAATLLRTGRLPGAHTSRRPAT